MVSFVVDSGVRVTTVVVSSSVVVLISGEGVAVVVKIVVFLSVVLGASDPKVELQILSNPAHSMQNSYKS